MAWPKGKSRKDYNKNRKTGAPKDAGPGPEPATAAASGGGADHPSVPLVTHSCKEDCSFCGDMKRMGGGPHPCPCHG